MPAATELMGPLTDSRTLSLALLSINSGRIWEGVPQRAMVVVLAEGVSFSKFIGRPDKSSSLRSFAAKGVISISSARIMSTGQRASLSESISTSASGGGLSPTKHLVACHSMWGWVVFTLVSAMASIRGLWGPGQAPRGINVVGTKEIHGIDYVAPVELGAIPEFPYAAGPRTPVRMY